MELTRWRRPVDSLEIDLAIATVPSRIGPPRSIVQPFGAGLVSMRTTVVSEKARLLGVGVPSVAVQFLR
jgi:hypothetical protein